MGDLNNFINVLCLNFKSEIKMVKSRIFKSTKIYEKDMPYKLTKGDLRMSFKTKSQAEKYKKTKKWKNAYINPVTFESVY